MDCRRLCRSANCASTGTEEAGSSAKGSVLEEELPPQALLAGILSFFVLELELDLELELEDGVSGVILSVVTTNLKTSKESAFSADAAVTPSW